MSFDATEGVGFCMESIISVIGYCFSLLESIKLGDTTLLTIALSMFLLSALIPILFSILAYRSSGSAAIDFKNSEYYESPKQRQQKEFKERYDKMVAWKAYVKSRNKKG